MLAVIKKQFEKAWNVEARRVKKKRKKPGKQIALIFVR